MAVTSATAHEIPGSEPKGFEHLAVEQVQNWCNVIEGFIQWQTRHVLHANPSDETQADHKQGLKWMLRLTKLIHSVASDPEFPDKTLLGQFEAQMHQLETSWEIFYNPMLEAKADRILAKTFSHGR
jgi:hypothetical protein